MLYRIACCDDEQQILDRLKECFVRLEVQTDIETQVDYYTDGRNLIQAYQADHSKYDIILLDMEMPLISGMQVAEQMRRIKRGTYYFSYQLSGVYAAKLSSVALSILNETIRNGFIY